MQSIGTCRFQLLSSIIFRKQAARKHRHPKGVQTFRQFMSETWIATYKTHSLNSFADILTLMTCNQALSGFTRTETTTTNLEGEIYKTSDEDVYTGLLLLLLLLLFLSIEFSPDLFFWFCFRFIPGCHGGNPTRGRIIAAFFLIFGTRQRKVFSFMFHLLYLN